MTPEQLQQRQEELKARNSPEPKVRERHGHNRRSQSEKLLRAIMLDPNASPDARVKATLGYERMKARRRLAQKKELALAPAEPEATTPEPLAEDVEAALAEIQERIDADNKLAAEFRAKRQAFFDSHPDRAGETMAIIGATEFIRITQ